MTDRLIWHGEWTTRRRLRWRGLFCIGPAAVWLFVFLILPCMLLIPLAFATRGAYGEIIFTEVDDAGQNVWRLTFEQFRRLAGYGILGWNADYLRIGLRTLTMAAATTLICITLAYPIAFFLAARSLRWRNFWLLMLVIPLCTNLVIRTYGWQLLLSGQWPLSRLAAWLGMIDPGAALYPGAIAVYLGLISSALPFAVLPIYTNVERMDMSLLDAVNDLYGRRFGVFRHGVLPQTISGLIVAATITFIPAMGVFLIPDLLGGSKQLYLGSLIQQQFGASRNFPLGAAISLVIMVLTLAVLMLMRPRALRGVTA